MYIILVIEVCTLYSNNNNNNRAVFHVNCTKIFLHKIKSELWYFEDVKVHMFQ